jgi:hypothetical protein
MRTVRATRYVTPLREGGSLPAIVEADDEGLYVVKFRGAGQGPRALVAEVIAGELARAAGLRVPELVLVEVDAALGRNEADPEIRELLKASVGVNVGLDFLPGSAGYDPAVGPPPPADEASAVVWFDAFTQNVDRTARNTNLLVWHRQLWLIDHGAALWYHHAWDGAAAQVRSPFPRVREHVLLPFADGVARAGARLRPRLGREVLARAAGAVPEAWLAVEPRFAGAAAHRAAYVDHLAARLAAASVFEEEAERARAQLV